MLSGKREQPSMMRPGWVTRRQRIPDGASSPDHRGQLGQDSHKSQGSLASWHLEIQRCDNASIVGLTGNASGREDTHFHYNDGQE